MSTPTHISISLPPSSFVTISRALRTAANHHHTYACTPTLTPAASASQTAYAKSLETLASDIEHILQSADIAAIDAFLAE